MDTKDRKDSKNSNECKDAADLTVVTNQEGQEGDFNFKLGVVGDTQYWDGDDAEVDEMEWRVLDGGVKINTFGKKNRKRNYRNRYL